MNNILTTDNRTLAIKELLNQSRVMAQPIPCRCTKCHGLGFAEDETMLDSKGYLMDMRCPCGGRIRKVR